MRIAPISSACFAVTLLFELSGCSDNANPHKVILSKSTDNYGTVINLSYNNNNQITSIKKTSTSKVITTTITYQADSVLIDDSENGMTVIKFVNSLPSQEYSYLKANPASILGVIHYKIENNLIVAATDKSSDPTSSDSTVIAYTWSGGNITSYTIKNYKFGGVSSEHSVNCTYDQGNNFSNGNYLLRWALGFEGGLFALCKNNLVSTSYTDNSLAICCYEFTYNSNRYPSGIRGVQLDTYSLEYIDPK